MWRELQLKSNYGTKEKFTSNGHYAACKILEQPATFEMQQIVQNLDSVRLLRHQQFCIVINHHLCTMTTNYPLISDNKKLLLLLFYNPGYFPPSPPQETFGPWSTCKPSYPNAPGKTMGGGQRR